MDDNYKKRIVEIFNSLELLSPEEKLIQVHAGITKAITLISQKKPFIFEIIDKTNAGGLHKVSILISPQKNTIFLEIPDEANTTPGTIFSGIKGGRIPTIYHGIEIVTLCYKAAKKEFPKLEFGIISFNYLYSLRDVFDKAKGNSIIIPLTIDPPLTNVIIVHTQVRQINPEILARGWYEVMKLDKTLIKDVIRHTILVMPMSPNPSNPNVYFSIDQPKAKNQVYTEILPNNIVGDRSRFRPLYLSRISRWSNIINLNQHIKPRVDIVGTRSIIYLS
jgi:hypothetical protein